MENPPPSREENPLIEMINAAIAPAQFLENIEVEGVNWRVLPGSFWVAAGLFGAGKSDLLSVAAGLQRPASGLVKLFGHETFTLKEEILVAHRRRIGIVFANGGRLFNRLTVAENVALPMRYHHNRREADAEESVREILELTGLISFAHKIPGTLNSSWQQRAALARALILKPEILLLDKPLLGMDFRHRRWTLDFLTALSEGSPFYGGKGITLVVTSEDIEPWKNVAQQFAILKNKQWQQIGGRAELAASGEPLLRELWAEDI